MLAITLFAITCSCSSQGKSIELKSGILRKTYFMFLEFPNFLRILSSSYKMVMI
jgi:hypothetical protein